VVKLDEDAAAVVVAKRVEDAWQGAAVYEENGILTSIIEKPLPGTSTTNWNSAGSYGFREDVFPELKRVPLSARGEYELTSAVQRLILAGHKLRLYPLQGSWRDVGNTCAHPIMKTDRRPINLGQLADRFMDCLQPLPRWQWPLRIAVAQR